jgi:molecular chaperone GrpE
VAPGSPAAASDGSASPASASSPSEEADEELIAAVNEILAKASADDEAVSAAQSSEAPAPKTLQELVDERTADLQRLQAEYANYKKRVDRDRALSRAAGIEAVVLDLLPVLDSVEAAREHEELVGGFKLVADELERIAGKYGLEAYGEVGDEFDPQVHEALMQMPYEGETQGPVVAAVMQKGVRLNGRVLRPARVGVANTE